MIAKEQICSYTAEPLILLVFYLEYFLYHDFAL